MLGLFLIAFTSCESKHCLILNARLEFAIVWAVDLAIVCRLVLVVATLHADYAMFMFVTCVIVTSVL